MDLGQCVVLWAHGLGSSRTVKNYCVDLQQFYMWSASRGWDLKFPGDVTPAVAAEWWKYLLRKYGRQRTDGEWVATTTTAWRKFACISSLLQFCANNGHINANPCLSVKIGSRAKGKPRQAVPLGDVRKIILWASKEANQGARIVGRVPAATAASRSLAFVLLATTGMRVTEVCSVRASDFDDVAGNPTLTVLGKGSKVNRIVLHAATALCVRRYLAQFPRTPETRLVAVVGSKRIIVRAATISQWLKEACELLRIPHMTPHQFRSTLATELHLAGTPLADIQRLLGHASVETTARYVHLVDEKRQAAALRIDVLG